MITRLKISRSATAILQKRYTALRQIFTPNIILRNAMMFSINNGDLYDDDEPNTGGSEFQISTLLGSKARLYELLFNQYYGRKLDDGEFKAIMSYHAEQGLRHTDFESVFKV